MATADEREPLSRNACILRLVFGIFILAWWLVRWLFTVGGIMGAIGVVAVFAVPVLLLVLFGDQDWFARQGTGDDPDTIAGWGAVVFFGPILLGIALWIVGIVRKRAARSQ